MRDWVESDAAFEVTVSGDPAPVVKDLQDFLASRNQKGTVAAGDVLPFLAEPIVDFTLRDDVRWHDGAPFTSSDVVFTYRAIMDDAVASPRKPDFLYIQAVETPDPHTVRVVYRKPYSPALQSWMIGLLPPTCSRASRRNGGRRISTATRSAPGRSSSPSGRRMSTCGWCVTRITSAHRGRGWTPWSTAY